MAELTTAGVGILAALVTIVLWVLKGLKDDIRGIRAELKADIAEVRKEGRETYGLVKELGGTLRAPAAQVDATIEVGKLRREVEALRALVKVGEGPA